MTFTFLRDDATQGCEKAGLPVPRSWAAIIVEIHSAPLVGALPGTPGCVVVAGANGYTLGPLLGRAAADAVASGNLSPEFKAFSPDRLAGMSA